MIKKSITYTDFNDNVVTDDFWFHLSKSELIEMELSGKDGSLGAQLQEIIRSNNNAQIISAFKKLILQSVGQKSEDGKRFIKTEQFAKEFEQTAAYSELFIGLCTNASAGADFVNGVVPAGLNQLGKDLEKAADRPAPPTPEQLGVTAGNGVEVPAVPEFKELSSEELRNLSQDELIAHFRAKEEYQRARQQSS